MAEGPVGTDGSDGSADADSDSDGRNLPVPLPKEGFGAPRTDRGGKRPELGDPELLPDDAARLEAARDARRRAGAIERRRRRHRRYLFLGLGLIALVIAAEGVGRFLFAGRVEEEYSVDDASSVTVELGGLGLIPRAFVLGTVDDLTIVYDDLDAGPIRVTEMRVDITGGDLDVSDLLTREVTINGAESVRVVAAFDPDTVTRLVGFDSAIRDGQVLVGGPGGLQAVEPRLEGRVVRFQGGFSSFDLPVPEERWLPCDPTVRVVDEMIRLECLLDDLPTAMGGPTRP